MEMMTVLFWIVDLLCKMSNKKILFNTFSKYNTHVRAQTNVTVSLLMILTTSKIETSSENDAY